MTPLRRYVIRMVGALLMAVGTCALAQAPQAAGRFVSVTGEVAVVARDGARRAAERGGEIREGDTIITGDSSLAQARMSDGGLISVRAESEFKLEQFAYKGREDRNASFVVNILKGGFRTITGLIAQVNRSGYKITTPAATIGVRGTHFEVVHVLPQIATPDVPSGTYNRVFEGITTVQNPGGNVLQVVREQTAFASLQGGNPLLVAPPARLFGRPTPVPRASVPQIEERAQKAAGKSEERAAKIERGAPVILRDRPIVRESVPISPLEPSRTITTVPLSPIETTTVSPTTTTILQSPTTTLDRSTTTISPTLSPTTTISPTTTTTTTTIIQQPITSPILQSPTTILQSPTTTTTTTTSPTTTTIRQPTTTTISPTLTR